MKNTNVKWFKLFVLFLFLACKSTDPVPEEQHDEDVKIEIKEFADRIKDKTNLVKNITKNTVQQIAAGLAYAEVEYQRPDDAPMRLYILLADLTKDVTLAASAAADGEDLNAKETVRRQISYVEDRGYDVLAALNADFWRTNANETDNTPMGQAYGVLYMDAVMKKDVTRSASDYYFGAILKDGSFLMGDKLALLRTRDNIKEAVGGRYLLVKDGKDVSSQISNKDTNPRTSIGEFDAHNVVFVVVDGRRADHSQGATMQELGEIYQAIGVNTAINLDGGGSTTLILKDSGGELVLENQPSDNVERAVTNSWTIVKK